MITKILSAAYFLIGLLFIVIHNYSSQLTDLILKGLILPVLIIIFIINREKDHMLLNSLMMAGLFFSWAGDVVLQFSFVPGLILFLLAHIMYLSVFFLTPGKSVIFSSRKYLLIPVFLYGAGLLFFLYNDLGDMKIPVIVYSIIILTMMAGAINRMSKVNLCSFRLVLAGAILFLISDSCIAVNKFSLQIPSSTLVIMSTYLLAQYLIIMGYLKQFSNDQSNPQQ